MKLMTFLRRLPQPTEDGSRARDLVGAGVLGSGLTMFIVLVVMWITGCATTGRGPSMGCLDPLATDCKDPTAYPPLTAMLPPWPFPSLLVPLPEDRR